MLLAGRAAWNRGATPQPDSEAIHNYKCQESACRVTVTDLEPFTSQPPQQTDCFCYMYRGRLLDYVLRASPGGNAPLPMIPRFGRWLPFLCDDGRSQGERARSQQRDAAQLPWLRTALACARRNHYSPILVAPATPQTEIPRKSSPPAGLGRNDGASGNSPNAALSQRDSDHQHCDPGVSWWQLYLLVHVAG